MLRHGDRCIGLMFRRRTGACTASCRYHCRRIRGRGGARLARESCSGVGLPLPLPRHLSHPRANAGDQPLAQRPDGAAPGGQSADHTAARQSGQRISMAGRHSEHFVAPIDGPATVFAATAWKRRGFGHLHVRFSSGPAGQRFDPPLLHTAKRTGPTARRIYRRRYSRSNHAGPCASNLPSYLSETR